jgi:hypothetical protein
MESVVVLLLLSLFPPPISLREILGVVVTGTAFSEMGDTSPMLLAIRCWSGGGFIGPMPEFEVGAMFCGGAPFRPAL